MTAIRHDAHKSRILLVVHRGELVITLGYSGVLIVWRRTPHDTTFTTLRDPGVRSGIRAKPHWCQEVKGEIWAVYIHDVLDPHSACSLVMFGLDKSDRAVVLGEQSFRLEGPRGVPSGATIVPSDPNAVYIAHK